MDESKVYLMSRVRELEEKVRNLEDKFNDEVWRYYIIRKASEDWGDAREIFEF